MVEKENLAPGTPFDPLFTGIRSKELVAIIADTLLFLVIGTLAMVVILTMSLDFRESASFAITAGVIVLAILIFGLYLAARRSIKHIKKEARKPEHR